MIKINIDKQLEKIIDRAFETGFKEISFENEKPIIFMKFSNNGLEFQEFNIPNLKIDINLIEKFSQNISSIENKDKENFVKTFVTPINKKLCRAYIFRNQNGKTINIKILDQNLEDLKTYVAKVSNMTNEKKGDFYNEILKNSGGIVVVSSQTENLKKNFLYSIMEEINKTKTSKIISFEEPVEQLLVNKKSFVYQMKYLEESIGYIRFLTPDYVFIHETMNKEILLNAIRMANSGVKVFISSPNTDAERNLVNIINYLDGEILGLETFEHLFKFFITLATDKYGNNLIWKVSDTIEIKR
jgi:Tfp pilus assembly pilus retraction ATPase PilT